MHPALMELCVEYLNKKKKKGKSKTKKRFQQKKKCEMMISQGSALSTPLIKYFQNLFLKQAFSIT